MFGFSKYSFLALAMAGLARASNTISTDGFSLCSSNSTITVSEFYVSFDKSTSEVTFDVSGSSSSIANVTAVLNITAYGNNVFSKTFSPCAYNVEQLCPVPSGAFSGSGSIAVPGGVVSQIPSIAFEIPDLDGQATLQLYAEDGTELACLTSSVTNGKSTDVAGVKYATIGIAVGAAALSTFGSLMSSSSAGGSTHLSPSFVEVMWWFQGIALNGALSVNYPSVYRNFAKNFQWSTGLWGWEWMQNGIDGFRVKSGGSLTKGSYLTLRNTTLAFGNGSDSSSSTTVAKRGLEGLVDGLLKRDITIGGLGTGTEADNSTDSNSSLTTVVNGLKAFSEQIEVPSTNTFMTVLLIFLIIIAAISVLILGFRVILEVKCPQKLQGFRKRYWWFLSGTLVRVVLILYGTWAMFCLYQFRRGDSWAADLLAAITLALFTGILAFFTVRIVMLARRARKLQGGVQELYEHKPWLRKYGLFYDSFRTRFWWFFIPLILYSLIKGAFIALADGNGLVQTCGQLGAEVLLLFLMLWDRPYDNRGANIINIVISVVRILSCVCLLIFVEELGIQATSKTVTGVALIVIQSVLTAVLAILIIVNAVKAMMPKKPNQNQEKKMENGESDDEDVLTTLTPMGKGGSMRRSEREMDDMEKLGLKRGDGYMRTPTQENFARFGFQEREVSPSRSRGSSPDSRGGVLVAEEGDIGKERYSLGGEDYAYQGPTIAGWGHGHGQGIHRTESREGLVPNAADYDRTASVYEAYSRGYAQNNRL
ncbi:hypothetical protein G7K_3817-t1 [Saitoella complicata NRRL Y-17804]|uniref:ML-like domain-containing protein n=2 Tax=Saitoella complicata (strain BCRC 22490 / CBS 7301 / JCM 7358 / NBRC 10748 / NRRL Y-17804) TaxID=698492 RepID=A0A0E9NJT8_SAICN|nr:hypothetical protein G7K_3817-t1 [Saitoella complicata NRRL Y-17804]